MSLTKELLLTLKQLKGIGPKTILKVGQYLIDNNIQAVSTDDLFPVLEVLKLKVNKELITKSMLNNAYQFAQSSIKEHEDAGIRITTYYDSDFPTDLRKAINEDGTLNPPVILYYKGDLSITQMPCLAIIGTREVEDFGIQAGSYLSKKFVQNGFCIVSGLAIGCDTVGHRGALEENGKTIAFLAHGLDSIYPPENEELANEIVSNGGLLMSEYPIKTPVNKYQLVARDRLQAAMSKATLVIQTGEHGGTMHAANTTLVDKKPLYVVKYQSEEQNNHEKSLGNALLVKKGAKYISGGDDLSVVAKDILEYTKPQKSLFD